MNDKYRLNIMKDFIHRWGIDLGVCEECRRLTYSGIRFEVEFVVYDNIALHVWRANNRCIWDGVNKVAVLRGLRG